MQIHHSTSHDIITLPATAYNRINMLTTSFPSLVQHMSTSRVLGLYFASAWCPDCTPVTPKLKSIFENQPASDFSVVYVSSDNSEQQMMDVFQNQHGKWGMIPFGNFEERNNLKRHFGVCAGKEAMGLGMMTTRKYGIPTLVLIDCATQEVLTYDGVTDVMNGSLLQKWF